MEENKGYNLDEIYTMIRGFNNDPNVLKLQHNYSRRPFMDILGIARTETAHSSFLAWLFNPNENYGLGLTPLRLLLELLVNYKGNVSIPKDLDEGSIIVRSLDISSVNVEREYHLDDNKGFLDIYIEFQVKSEIYGIVIENKIDAKENVKKTEDKEEYQTEKYYEYFRSNGKNIKTIFVFLSPEHNGKLEGTDNPHFINISYRMLTESVLDNLLLDTNINETAKFYLEEYIRILYRPSLYILEKSSKKKEKQTILAISKSESETINKIKDDHKDLGRLIFEDNENLSNEIGSVIDNFKEANRTILDLLWPDYTGKTKRSKNRTFDELEIEVGTILYLSDKADSDNKMIPEHRVRTLDYRSKVEFLDDPYLPTKLSNAAAILQNTRALNGFRYFVCEKDGKYINLFKIERKYIC